MRLFIRWWATLGKSERIVALAIGLSAPIAIINSTVWAITVAYMSHQRALVEIERLRLEEFRAAEQVPVGAPILPADAAAPRSAPDAN